MGAYDAYSYGVLKYTCETRRVDFDSKSLIQDEVFETQNHAQDLKQVDQSQKKLDLVANSLANCSVTEHVHVYSLVPYMAMTCKILMSIVQLLVTKGTCMPYKLYLKWVLIFIECLYPYSQGMVLHV